MNSPRSATARGFAQEEVNIAERLQDPRVLAPVYAARGITLLWHGELPASHEDLSKAAAIYAEEAPIGQAEEGLRILAPALALVERTGDRLFEEELHRLKGEMLLIGDDGVVVEGAQCFRDAIEVARRQSAKSWELRATTSLARLLTKQGKRDEAHAILADIYNWFTEGFDTADLKTRRRCSTNLAVRCS